MVWMASIILPWLEIPQTSEVGRKKAHRGDRARRIRAWRLQPPGRSVGAASQIKGECSLWPTAEEGSARLWAPLKRQLPSDLCASLRLKCLGWRSKPTADYADFSDAFGDAPACAEPSAGRPAFIRCIRVIRGQHAWGLSFARLEI